MRSEAIWIVLRSRIEERTVSQEKGAGGTPINRLGLFFPCGKIGVVD